MDGSKCRFFECNIGNMVTSAIMSARVEQQTGQYATDASIAFMLGGDIRASIKMGNITKFDLEMAFPYKNPLSKKHVFFINCVPNAEVF